MTQLIDYDYDFNMNQLDNNLNDQLLNIMELQGCGLLNQITATNILKARCKMSIVHCPASDHSIVFGSIGLNLKILRSRITKTKLNLPEAVRRVEHLCDSTPAANANELNIALENIDST